MKFETCEWCGVKYPMGAFTFYSMRTFNMSLPVEPEVEHKICHTCYEQLEDVDR